MLPIPLLSYQDLHEFALNCEKQLLVENPHEFIYPTKVRNNKDENLWNQHIPIIKQINDTLLTVCDITLISMLSINVIQLKINGDLFMLGNENQKE